MNQRAVAPDGSPLALYLALPGEEEAALVHGAIPAGASILELGCGPGRVTRPLLSLRHAVTAVDNSADMLVHLPAEAEAVLADMRTLDLAPRRWPVVLFASHGLNDPLGATFLAVAARHVEPKGCVLVQHHSPGAIDAMSPGERERDGVTIGVTDVEHPAPGVVVATMVYVVNGVTYRQPFTAHDADVAAMATAAGLAVDATLDDAGTWTRLVPA